jgi:hypothetical protein
MKLIKKGDNKLKSFWVQDYNETDKAFLESIGFAERKILIGYKTHLHTMEFAGSGMFGFWSDEESERIYSAVKDYLNCGKLKIEIYIPS